MKSRYYPSQGTVLFRVLAHLAKHGPTTNGELEVHLGVARHSMPGFVTSGIKAGLLHRATVDGVRKFVLGPMPPPAEIPDEPEFENAGEAPFKHRVVSDWKPIVLARGAVRSIFEMAEA